LQVTLEDVIERFVVDINRDGLCELLREFLRDSQQMIVNFDFIQNEGNNLLRGEQLFIEII